MDEQQKNVFNVIIILILLILICWSATDSLHTICVKKKKDLGGIMSIDDCAEIRPSNFKAYLGVFGGKYPYSQFYNYPLHFAITLFVIISAILLIALLYSIYFDKPIPSTFLSFCSFLTLNMGSNVLKLFSKQLKKWKWQITLATAVSFYLFIFLWIIPSMNEKIMDNKFFLMWIIIAVFVLCSIIFIQFNGVQTENLGMFAGFKELDIKFVKLIKSLSSVFLGIIIFIALMYIYVSVDFGASIMNIIIVGGILYLIKKYAGNEIASFGPIKQAKEMASVAGGKVGSAFQAASTAYKEDAGKTENIIYFVLLFEILYILIFILGPRFYKKDDAKTPILEKENQDAWQAKLQKLKDEVSRIKGTNVLAKIVNSIFNAKKYQLAIDIDWNNEFVTNVNKIDSTVRRDAIIDMLGEKTAEEGCGTLPTEPDVNASAADWDKYDKGIINCRSKQETFWDKINPRKKPSLAFALAHVLEQGPRLHQIKMEIADLEQKIEAEKDIPTTHKLRRFVTNPIYTDSEAIFSNDNEDHSFTSNYNYSLSFWLFIHDSQSNTDGYCNILNYGDKPLIEYDENIHSLRVKIIQTVGDNEEAVEEEKIILETKDNSKNILPLQRWNNIVINYNGGIMDIFINKELVAHKIKIIPHMKHDRIRIGQTNGMAGGICNVIYYPEVLTKTEIDSKYEYVQLLKLNPPIY